MYEVFLEFLIAEEYQNFNLVKEELGPEFLEPQLWIGETPIELTKQFSDLGKARNTTNYLTDYFDWTFFFN